MSLIELRQLEKVYTTGKMEFHALRAVDLDIDEGEVTAIMGPSGCSSRTSSSRSSPPC